MTANVNFSTYSSTETRKKRIHQYDAEVVDLDNESHYFSFEASSDEVASSMAEAIAYDNGISCISYITLNKD